MQNPDDVLSRLIFTLITESMVTVQGCIPALSKVTSSGIKSKTGRHLRHVRVISDVYKFDIGHVGAHEKPVECAEFLREVADKKVRRSGCARWVQHASFLKRLLCPTGDGFRGIDDGDAWNRPCFRSYAAG